MTELAGKVAIVTGASKGIGAGIAKDLAEAGASVVVNYASSREGADRVVAEIENAGGNALAIQADVARIDDIRRLFRETVERLGRLDMLITNAGYSVFKPLVDITEHDFEQTYRLNTRGTFFCLQEALRYMADSGKIVCISTIGTELNVPGGSCYFGSKAAIEQFCRALQVRIISRVGLIELHNRCSAARRWWCFYQSDLTAVCAASALPAPCQSKCRKGEPTKPTQPVGEGMHCRRVATPRREECISISWRHRRESAVNLLFTLRPAHG